MPTSVVTDLESSWPDRAKGRSMFGRVLTSESPGRAFYQVRNRVFFEGQHWMGSKSLHRANRALTISCCCGSTLYAWDEQLDFS